MEPAKNAVTREEYPHILDASRHQKGPGAKRSSPLRPSFERLLELARLPRDWDSEGAEPPTGCAVAAAALLMTVAHDRGRERDTPAFSAPIPDGGVQVEWEGPNARVDVQVNPDGSFGYLLTQGVGPVAEYREADESPLDEVLELIDLVLNS